MPARIHVLLLCALLPLAGANAAAPDLLRYEHENLASGETETLESLRGSASLLLFFQPDCKWCLRQSRALDELLSACPDTVAAAALGVHGNRVELRQELRRLRPDYPAYAAGPGMLQAMQGVPATPLMLLADEQGAFSEVFSGYIPADRLQALLAERFGVRCG